MVNWLVNDFRQCMVWVIDTCPKITIFYHSQRSMSFGHGQIVFAQPPQTTSTVTSQFLDELNLAPGPSTQFSVDPVSFLFFFSPFLISDGYHSFVFSQLEPLPMGITESPSAKQREKLVSLFQPLLAIFNLRKLDVLPLSAGIASIVSSNPPSLCVAAVSAACVTITDVEALADVCEVFFEQLLCGGESKLGTNVRLWICEKC